MFQSGKAAFSDSNAVDVTIVMPCLNEAQSLPHCIANARDALDRIADQYGLSGEIVIADNGSTDGSRVLATSLGARVVPVEERGYGAALIGGCHGALGRYILMGDCDGSYDFTDGVAMIGKLIEGHALCMGSRFDGGIAPGAMPWKNRYIGNPVLTGILNLFFRSGINDAHCGLRAIRKESFLRLNLSGTGMEFASEMVIKASLLRMPITQVPATLSPDLRQRAPHLRPWRDGWRHLRYLMMLSPTWAFGVPALAAMGVGLAVLIVAAMSALGLSSHNIPFGESWILIGAMLCCVGQMGALMAVAVHLYGVRQGYRRPRAWLVQVRRFLNLETFAIAGGAMVLVALAAIVIVLVHWSHSAYAALPSILPLAAAATLGVCGLQTLFGGVLLAVVGGNEADFMKRALAERKIDATGLAALSTEISV
jgi:hypothetical protein